MYMFRHIVCVAVLAHQHCMDIAYCLCTYKKLLKAIYCNAFAIVEQCMFEPKWNPAFNLKVHTDLCHYVTDCRGTFRMERQDRKLFEVHIRAFSLESHLQGPSSSLLPHYQQPATSTN